MFAQAAAAEKIAAQAAAAAATAAPFELSNKHLQDPSTAIFWSSRGYSTPPWRWPSFTQYGCSWPFRRATYWPGFLKVLKYLELDWTDGSSDYERSQLTSALDQQLRAFGYGCMPDSYAGDSMPVSMRIDILNLRADASLFDHLR